MSAARRRSVGEAITTTMAALAGGRGAVFLTALRTVIYLVILEIRVNRRFLVL